MVIVDRKKGAVAQGDCMIVPIDSIPKDAVKSGSLVVAHSETGHHHELDVARAGEARLYTTSNPMICYLAVTGEYADIVHRRPWDTHETLRIPTGNYVVYRQREGAPEGWRQVAD